MSSTRRFGHREEIWASARSDDRDVQILIGNFIIETRRAFFVFIDFGDFEESAIRVIEIEKNVDGLLPPTDGYGLTPDHRSQRC